ncbi:hypothetical protein EVAR_10450_1 [Eumeta japonica]|uniref:Uncharacterized protein n=1 Tax=Eumeta variegata TaxID=151549 RepID=A0A4C1TKA5_EUMVA|nr:hypothetical protein EVAR_10450_1 [Eumeta japonica]
MTAFQGAIRRVKNVEDSLVNIFNDCRRAALTRKTAAGYDRFPLSYARKVKRATSLEEWQERYGKDTIAYDTIR